MTQMKKGMAEQPPRLPVLRATYHPQAGVSIEGAAGALLAVAEILRAAVDETASVRLGPAEDADAGRALTELRVELRTGPVYIGVDGGILLFRGGRDQLGILADNLAWFATNGDPADPLEHMHEEYYDMPGREHHLAPDAEPLVVGLRKG
jgi:hypothetical protein